MEGSCERSSNYVTYIIAKSCKRCTLHVVVEGNPAALQEAIYNMVDFICIGQRHWIGLVVRTSAFHPEGWWFESTKGYTPDRDMCASLLVGVAPYCKSSPG